MSTLLEDICQPVNTGLTEGVAYRFTVAAVNAIGTSPYSAQSNQVNPS